MDRLEALGAQDPWFRLGDRDLATHLWRTDRLRRRRSPDGRRARAPARRWASAATILPMADAARPDRGPDRRRLARVPGVLRPSPPGAGRCARSGSAALETAPADARGRWRRSPPPSVDRHRAIEPDRVDRPDPGGRRACRGALQAARARGVPVVAVSGIVGGKALKGPADRMLASLGHESSALGVARHLRRPRSTPFVLDTRRRRAGAGDRGARARAARRRHDHDRRRGAGAGGRRAVLAGDRATSPIGR